jgi:hypothetical protein
MGRLALDKNRMYAWIKFFTKLDVRRTFFNLIYKNNMCFNSLHLKNTYLFTHLMGQPNNQLNLEQTRIDITRDN